jgi:hypothetical protein
MPTSNTLSQPGPYARRKGSTAATPPAAIKQRLRLRIALALALLAGYKSTTRALLLVRTEVALQPAASCANKGTIQCDFGSFEGPGAVSDQPKSRRDQMMTVV